MKDEGSFGINPVLRIDPKPIPYSVWWTKFSWQKEKKTMHKLIKQDLFKSIQSVLRIRICVTLNLYAHGQ